MADSLSDSGARVASAPSRDCFEELLESALRAVFTARLGDCAYRAGKDVGRFVAERSPV